MPRRRTLGPGQWPGDEISDDSDAEQVDDPHELRRFTKAQRVDFARALREIQAGQKTTCWMWYVIPTATYVIDGVERGSCFNRRYALRSDEQARAFLKFAADGVDLRNNYLRIMETVRDQLRSGAKAVSLVGSRDEPKLSSSAKLFERLTRSGGDDELNGMLRQVLKLMRDAPEGERSLNERG